VGQTADLPGPGADDLSRAPHPGGAGRRGLARRGRWAQDRAILALSDIARFRPDDPDALVAAALACPVCLNESEIGWTPELDGYDPSVGCRCPSCQIRWRVYLAPEQALRLSLMLVAA
jgi:hypothetical protein